MNKPNHENEAARLKTLGLRPFKLWHEESTPDLRIEIIPLIDVIFCVLTFFILAAVNLSRQQAINLDLPSANSGTAQMPNMAIVSLTDFGQIYVEKQLIQTQAQFTQILEDYLQRNPEGLVILNASEKRSYQEVMQVLDWLKSIGGTRVALGTMSGSQTGGQDNLGVFFDEQQNPGVTPVNPAIPQVPTVQPSNDFQLEPLKSNESLPPPEGFQLDLVPLEKFGEPPSPETLEKPQ